MNVLHDFSICPTPKELCDVDHNFFQSRRFRDEIEKLTSLTLEVFRCSKFYSICRGRIM